MVHVVGSKEEGNNASSHSLKDIKMTNANSVMASVVTSATKVAAGKVENYSADVTVKLLAAWDTSDKKRDDVEVLAVMFGKSIRSIVAKLSREKVYVKPAYVSKASGVAPVSKESHVATIAAFMGVDVDKLESLEKANKTVLMLIESTLLKMAHAQDEVK